MRRAALGIPVAIALAVVAVFGATRFWPRGTMPTTAEAPVPAEPTGTVKFLMEQQWAIRMKLAKVESAATARQIAAPARVVPAAGHHAVVAPPVAGVITSARILRVGETLGRGEPVATVRQVLTATENVQIETGRIEEVRLAAERRRAEEAVNEVDLRRSHARRELDRAQRLFERKAAPQRQVEAAEHDLKAAEAAYAGAIAHREALRDAPGPTPRAAGGGTSHIVMAPISGSIVKVAKSPGEQVGAGEVIAEIVSLDTVWVEVPIFERDLPRLARPIRAVFSSPTVPGKELSGRLVDLGAVVDPATRATRLVFELPNRDRALRIGLQVDARVDAGEQVETAMIPREAVVEAEGKRFVYVLRSGEEFERREVTSGDEYGATIAIVSGLKPGERVVTQGAWQLRQHELRPAGGGAHTHE
jgi:cobalt-zinc-cadmium efflux system membrane fusion protein